MITDVHQNQTIYRVGKSLREAKKALILLHGRGAIAQSILPLAGELGATDFAIVAPQAKDKSWYPNPSLSPRTHNEPHLGSAMTVLAGIIQGLNDADIPTENIALAGFAQGACVAAEFVANNPQRYCALIMFSGGLIGLGPSLTLSMYQKERYTGSLNATPVFMGCSDIDPSMPIDRFQKSGHILNELGADVTLKTYMNRERTIIFDEVEQAKSILAQIS